MSLKLIATKVKVPNVAELQEVLAHYVHNFHIRIIGKNGSEMLEISNKARRNARWEGQVSPIVDCLWPRALPLGRFDDMEVADDKMGNGYSDNAKKKEGQIGLLDLLHDLSLCLGAPLMIIAANTDEDVRCAQVWRSQPGVEEVETLMLRIG